MTTYVVMVETDRQGEFEIVGEIEANSAEQAIRKVVTATPTPDEGPWHAVPARSWGDGVKVKVETKVEVKFA
jgi:hypothetical protein